jgi:outer membrane protein assembly factor BamB
MTTRKKATEDEAHSRITVDLDQAVRLDIPFAGRELQARRFSTSDGREGWSLKIPGARPIATPAYEDGLLFIGGGYGSYAFYAFDAVTGELAWRMDTADDGPTAAVVDHGYVAFNTESCSVVVCQARTGQMVWDEWLGDPLMSQPAIAGDRLFIAYPADQRKPLLRPGMTIEQQREAIKKVKGNGQGRPHRHRMLCADLRTGEHLWEQELTGDVVTAPVVDGDRLFMTCLDGMSFCLDVEDGSVVWRKEHQGTSAPLVVEGRVIMTEKETLGQELYQRVRRSYRATGADHAAGRVYRRKSPYLHWSKGGGSSIKPDLAAMLDSSVGFASAPNSAKLSAASAHLGVSSVSGAWAYQGSRSAFARGRLFSNQGKHVCCLGEADEQVVWEAEVKGSGVDLDDQIFCPPALGREYVYLTSVWGHALSVRQDTGEVGIMYATGRPIAFQPCLAKGRMYFGTIHGDLVCIDTGSEDADGWYMWGGNAQHNKVN